jgi:hypothetical protein
MEGSYCAKTRAATTLAHLLIVVSSQTERGNSGCPSGLFLHKRAAGLGKISVP